MNEDQKAAIMDVLSMLLEGMENNSIVVTNCLLTPETLEMVPLQVGQDFVITISGRKVS